MVARVAVAAVLTLLAACDSDPPSDTDAESTPPTLHTTSPSPSPAPTRSSTPAHAPTTSPSPPTDSHPPRDETRFWVKDKTYYRSPWFAGEHQIMIGFGCTKAPYYTPDPRCPDHEGSHHGIDVAMPCGTRLYAGISGTVAPYDGPGAPGLAYGPYAFRIRNQTLGVDVLIGHVLRVYVQPGDPVRKGQLIARANHQGAPDGCHLHFEVRSPGGGLSTAVPPRRLLRLVAAH